MFIFKVLFLLVTFILLMRYRAGITQALAKTHVPTAVLFLITAAILITAEEQVNCQPSWCGRVILPPTLPFLLIEMSILAVIVWLTKAKHIGMAVTLYCIFGIAWELLIGGLSGVGSLTVLAIMIPWVGLSYAYISVVPLTLLKK